MFRQLITRSFFVLLFSFLTLLVWFTPVQAAINSNRVSISNPVNTELETEVLKIIKNHPEVVIESLEAYQRQQQEQQQQFRNLLSQELKTNPEKVIAESPITGAGEKKYLVLEFIDFQCSYCARAHKILKQFLATHQDEVTLVYKNLPLSTIHSEAMAAAKAAWAASQQGKFWQYHDALFDQQDQLGEELYLNIASRLDLDLNKFDKDRTGKEVNIAIERDIELADQIGVQGTPFFIINGQFFSGAIPLPTLEKALTLRQKT